MIYRDLRIQVRSLLLLICSLFCFPSDVLTQSGSLDPSFDQDGYLEQWFPSGGEGESLWATAIQPDGKIIIVGGTERWRVSRLNSDGSPDTSFNRTGNIVPELSNYQSSARSVVLQPDGKIVVGGSAKTITFNTPNSNAGYRISLKSLLIRYNIDGSIDPTFGENGVSIIAYGDLSDHELSSLLISPNGKILAVGSLRLSGRSQIALWRVNNDGSVDETFGNDGIVTTDIGSASFARTAALEGNGRIVVGGCAQISPYETDFAVVRYNDNGTLDLGFNGTGFAGLLNVAGSDCVTDVVLPGDGKIIVGGSFATQGGGSTYTIAKYDRDGPFDSSFNGYGAVPFASSPISRMILQSDGKLLVSGSGSGGPGQPYGLSTRRYLPYGTIDSTFGNLGQVFTPLPELSPSISAFAKAMAIQPNGRLLVVGNAGSSVGNARIARVIRYDGNGTPDSTFGSGGVLKLEVDSSNSTANSTFALPNGKILAAGGRGIMRFMPDGGLDRAFGESGKVSVNTFGTNDSINIAALQPDQKILAASSRQAQPNVPNRPIFLGRYLTNGSLDPTFGIGGEVVLTAGISVEVARALAVQDDGKIVLAATGYQNSVPRTLLFRLDHSGNLDSSFNDTGIVTAFVGPLSDAGALAIQSDGKILVVVRKGFSEAAVLRFNPNGSPDSAFGTAGNISIPFLVGNSIALQDDGKIVVGGSVRPPNSQSEFGVARLHSDGTLDGTFGSNGIAVTHITDYDDEGNTIKIQQNGQIVVAGSSYVLPPYNENRSDFAVVRYNIDGSLDLSWGVEGIAIADLLGGDSALGMDLDTEGRVVVSGESRKIFAVARFLGDTIPQTAFSVSGRVIDPNGRGIGSARVLITDSQGETYLATTSNFGYFTFDGLPQDDYILVVRSRRFRFATRPLSVSSDITEIVLTGID